MTEKNLNVRIINKHDTEENWVKATNFVPKQGELIVYDIDAMHPYERFKIGDGVTVVSSLPFAFAHMVPKMTTITLTANNWTGDTNPYSQVVTVNGATTNSKVDLQPTAAQIVELQNKEITLMLQNDDGVVTAWAIGNKPNADLTMQVLIQEVIPV